MRKVAQSASVTVVMGSYNAAAWIGTAIESALSQTHPVTEIVVVDDGSTDRTVEIARAFGSPVRLMEEEHRGRPHRNRGIESSSGALVAFLDADDYWHPTKLERQLARLGELNAEWVICGADWQDAATGHTVASAGMKPMEGDILKPLFLHNFIVASSCVVSRRALEAVGGFDETADVAPVEDWDLWLRIAGQYQVAGVEEQLVTLRLHADSFLASMSLPLTVRSLENVINRAARREPARLGQSRGAALHNAYFSAGVRAFRERREALARSFFLKAWQKRPEDASALAYVALTWMPRWASAALTSSKRRAWPGH